MADAVLLVVRALHILSAILWIGALGFSVMVLRQVMPRLGMPARKEVLRQLIPVVIRFVPVAAVLTIGFGAVLYLLLGDFDPNALWGTEWGRVLLGSLLLTLALFAFGILVVIRASRRILGHLNEEACYARSRDGPPHEDVQQRPGRRLRLGRRHPDSDGRGHGRPVAPDIHPAAGTTSTV